MENTLVQNILLSLICTAAFVIGLMYIKKIRNDKGDYEIMNDYRTDSYISPKEDLRKVLANEKWTLIFICVISILCYIINIIWCNLQCKSTHFFLSAEYFSIEI
jgi:hypothetical protein